MTRRCSLFVFALMLTVSSVSVAQASPTSLTPGVPVSPRDVGGSVLAFDPVSGTAVAVYNRRGVVFGRHLGPRGRPLGAPVRISTTPQALGAEIAFNPKTREYLVAWHSGSNRAVDLPIRGRRLALTGLPVGQSDSEIGQQPVSTAFPLAVAAGGSDGGYVVAFQGREGGIFVRVLDSSGVVAAESLVFGRSDCAYPRVVYRSSADEYLIGWACGLPGFSGADPTTYFVKRLSASGEGLGPSQPIITPRYVGRATGELALSYNPRLDQFLLVAQSPGRASMQTRRLDGAGQPIGAVRALRRVSFAYEGGQPEVAFDQRTRRYLVTWSGYQPKGREDVIRSLFSTRVGERGVERGSEAVLANANATSLASRGPRGGFLVAISDTRPGRAGVTRYLAR